MRKEGKTPTWRDAFDSFYEAHDGFWLFPGTVNPVIFLVIREEDWVLKWQELWNCGN